MLLNSISPSISGAPNSNSISMSREGCGNNIGKIIARMRNERNNKAVSEERESVSSSVNDLDAKEDEEAKTK